MDELNILTECALFRGLRRAQIREMLPCLSARQARSVPIGNAASTKT